MSQAQVRNLLILITVMNAVVAMVAISLYARMGDNPAQNRYVLCVIASELQSPEAWKKVKPQCDGFDIIPRIEREKGKS
jgi:hypothetical protein